MTFVVEDFVDGSPSQDVRIHLQKLGFDFFDISGDRQTRLDPSRAPRVKSFLQKEVGTDRSSSDRGKTNNPLDFVIFKNLQEIIFSICTKACGESTTPQSHIRNGYPEETRKGSS